MPTTRYKQNAHLMAKILALKSALEIEQLKLEALLAQEKLRITQKQQTPLPSSLHYHYHVKHKHDHHGSSHHNNVLSVFFTHSGGGGDGSSESEEEYNGESYHHFDQKNENANEHENDEVEMWKYFTRRGKISRCRRKIGKLKAQVDETRMALREICREAMVGY